MLLKKCWVFPFFLVYVFLRGEQMALETDISSKLFILNEEGIGKTRNAVTLQIKVPFINTEQKENILLINYLIKAL